MALQIIDLDRPVARHSFVTNSDVFSVLRDNVSRSSGESVWSSLLFISPSTMSGQVPETDL
jgi:hypothetical protein